MSLVTKCTACQTAFKVLPAQLSARGGRVRCGKCSTVFDGLANLVSAEIAADYEEDSARVSPVSAHAAAPVEAPRSLGEDADSSLRMAEEAGSAAPLLPQGSPAQFESVQAEQATPFPDIQAHVDAVPEQPGEPPAHAVQAPEKPAALRREGSTPGSAEQPVPDFLAERPPARRFSVMWALLALIAFIGLFAQAAYHFRTEVAVLVPQARLHLQTACDILGCEVPLPRRSELVSIESSALQADPQRAGVIVLNALLRNRAPFAQEYPSLELTLTDDKDQPIVRRVLAATDYAQDKRATLASGIAAGGEESVRVYIDAGRLRATGYRLYLFYP